MIVYDPKQQKHSARRVFGNVWYMFRYMFQYAPGYIWVTLIEGFGRAFYHILTSIVFIKYLFDAIERRVDFTELLLVIALTAAYIMAFECFNKWMLLVYRPKANLALHEGMQSELYKKARSLDQACYDDPEFYNDFVWAVRESDNRTVRMMVDLSIFINRIITTVAILSVLVTIDWIVALGVVASTSLSFLIKLNLNKINYEKSEALNPITRKLSYVERVFYLTDHAKELRQGEIAALMKQKYADAIEEEVACIKKFAPKLFWSGLLHTLVTDTLFDTCATGYLIIRYALDPALTLGGFSASINATWKLYWQINEITDYLTKFNEHSLYVDKFRRFIEYEPQIKGGIEQPGALHSLTLKNVSFAYPFGTKEGAEPAYALKNVSLTVKRGEKIAIVGYNGAGKTTLTKLIMRLYDATDGEILYNGKNIRDYDIPAYRAHIGVVFQDFKIFAATIAENVLGGEFDGSEETEETVLRALHAATFDDKLARLPDGILTPLTREFDSTGTVLSGGEAQKVAIARTFARPYDLIIMDEPSSALDPIAEYELNHSIVNGTADKAVIFISHRLSTTRMADRIYMFDGGTLVEVGSHDELMAMRGKYAAMYAVQAQKYRKEMILQE